MPKLGVAANRSFSISSQVPPTTPKFSRQCGAIDSQPRQTTVSRGSNRIQRFRTRHLLVNALMGDSSFQNDVADPCYYFGEITGSLGVDTRATIANSQRDYGLSITGAIDEATVEALGLY
jgi:hypothetical protein